MSGGEISCPAAGVCGLQGALHLALEDFLKRLDSYTLSDLLPDREKFVAKVKLEELPLPSG
jgi:DNA-binding IscR family transcriptional regulator